MADENIDMQEMAASVRQANEDVKTLGHISSGTATALNTATTGVRNFDNQMKYAARNMQTAAANFVKGMNSSMLGMSKYAEGISAVTDAVGTWALKFGAVGAAAGWLTKAFGSYAVEVGKQGDALWKAYEDISAAGASTAGGITDVFNNMQKMGYGADELDKFASVVRDNSETLARFGATTGAGLSTFASASNEIIRSDIGNKFLEMGMTVDGINKGMSGYLKMQTISGSRSIQTATQIAQASQQYIDELNTLSKLTGKSNEKLQSEREEMLAQERFAGLQYELQQRADAGDKAAALEMKKNEQLYALAGQYGKETQTAFLNSMTGTVNESNAKLIRMAPETFGLLNAPVKDVAAIMNTLSTESKEYMKTGAGLAMIGASKDFGIAIQELMKGINASKIPLEQRLKDVEAEKTIKDKQTKDYNEMLAAQRNLRDNVDVFINAGLGKATAALSSFATTTSDLIKKYAPDSLSKNPALEGRQFGASQIFTKAKPLPVTVVNDADLVEKARDKETKRLVDAGVISDGTERKGSPLKSGTEPSSWMPDWAIGQRAAAERAAKKDVNVQPKSREFSGKITKGPDFNVNEYLTKLIKAESDGRAQPKTPEPKYANVAIADILQIEKQIKLNTDKIKSEQDKIDKSKSGQDAYFGSEKSGIERSLKAIEQYQGRIERLEEKKKPTQPKSREFSGKITKGPDFNVNEYLTKLINAESNGRNIGTEIKGEDGKPTSSAYGLTQITKETFDSLVARAKEGDALYQKTHEEMKQDTTLQREATKLLVSDNSRQLTAAGIKITNASQHLAHVIGGPTAINALKAKDDTKVTDVLSLDQLASNPQLAKLATIADLKEWADKKIGGGGYKFGGVATGPDSGYDTTLHGTEAVVPLPDGRTIPVQMVGSDQQMGLMAAQLSRLDDIVRVMQNQLGVSQKILQYAQ